MYMYPCLRCGYLYQVYQNNYMLLLLQTSDPLPTRQEVATVPDINLTKYTKGLKLNSKLLHHKYGTRQKAENRLAFHKSCAVCTVVVLYYCRHFQTLEDPNLVR